MRLELFRWFAVAGVLSAAGCSADYFRSETVLHSDGSIDRAIYQPAEKVPAEAADPALWSRVTHAPRIEPADWQTPMESLPQAERDDEHPYLAAHGRFDSVEKLPRHFVRAIPGVGREGALERTTQRNDYVLIVEHVWEETLTDVVTLEDMHVARGELATLMIDAVQAVLEEGLGAEYDISRLVAWLRGEGTQWFSELTDVYYDAAVRKQFDSDEVIRRRFENVCARHGLAGVDNSAVEAFAAAKLRDLLRKRDGSPPDDAAVDAILVWLKIREAAVIDGQPQPSPLDAVAQRVIDRTYGGEEAFQKRLGAMAVRIVGLYGPLQTPEEFHYAMTMPGTIVETNGTLLADDRVEWTFSAAEAYPLGRRMTCRSLEPNAKLCRRLFGHEPLATRAARLSLVRLLAGDSELVEVLAACAKAGSLVPLEEHRATVDLMDDAAKQQSVRRLWKLLQLPI